MVKFTKIAVAEWFEAQGDNRVGAANSHLDCPLANYLHAQGDLEAEVHHNCWLNSKHVEKPLAIWARTFVELIDDSGGANNHDREFTGAQALVILQNQAPIENAKQTLFDLLSTVEVVDSRELVTAK